MKNKLVIIQFDFSGGNELLSYIEVLDSIKRETPSIYTTCLDFFNFSTLKQGYDVKLVKSNGDYILLSELLLNTKEYTAREIRKIHNVRKLLLANEFTFKSDLSEDL